MTLRILLVDKLKHMQLDGQETTREKRAFTVVDHRALMGAIALVITGVILADMLWHYLMAVAGESALTGSRLWWEIVLNLQILSAAMVWFCYSDRIEGSEGRIRRLQIVRRWFAIITVLLPSMLGAVGIQQNWFVDHPPDSFVWAFAFVVLLFWLSGVLVHALVQRNRRNRPPKASPVYRILFFLPVLLLLTITLLDAPYGGQTWLLAIPVLTYLQGAMPFISKAFGLR